MEVKLHVKHILAEFDKKNVFFLKDDIYEQYFTIKVATLSHAKIPNYAITFLLRSQLVRIPPSRDVIRYFTVASKRWNLFDKDCWSKRDIHFVKAFKTFSLCNKLQPNWITLIYANEISVQFRLGYPNMLFPFCKTRISVTTTFRPCYLVRYPLLQLRT